MTALPEMPDPVPPERRSGWKVALVVLVVAAVGLVLALTTGLLDLGGADDVEQGVTPGATATPEATPDG